VRAGDVVGGGQDIGSHGLAQLTHELLTAIGVDFQRFWVTWFRAEAKFGEAGRRGVAYLEEDSCTEGAGIESDGFCLSAEDFVVALGGSLLWRRLRFLLECGSSASMRWRTGARPKMS